MHGGASPGYVLLNWLILWLYLTSYSHTSVRNKCCCFFFLHFIQWLALYCNRSLLVLCKSCFFSKYNIWTFWVSDTLIEQRNKEKQWTWLPWIDIVLNRQHCTVQTLLNKAVTVSRFYEEVELLAGVLLYSNELLCSRWNRREPQLARGARRELCGSSPWTSPIRWRTASWTRQTL